MELNDLCLFSSCISITGQERSSSGDVPRHPDLPVRGARSALLQGTKAHSSLAILGHEAQSQPHAFLRVLNAFVPFIRSVEATLSDVLCFLRRPHSFLRLLALSVEATLSNALCFFIAGETFPKHDHGHHALSRGQAQHIHDRR